MSTIKLQAARKILMQTEIKQIAARMDLTKPLSAVYLNELSLENLQILQKELHARAVEVIAEIAELKATGDFEKMQFARRMFRSEIYDENEQMVFCYECEPRMAKYNIFTPGAWFQELLDELENLRAKYAENRESFEDREKERIISRLTGKRRDHLRVAA